MSETQAPEYTFAILSLLPILASVEGGEAGRDQTMQTLS